jgi:TRAP-type C4-dicarboxylate transport system substrate-binding protein
VQAGKENIEKARKGITAADPALLKQIEGNGVALVTPTAEERAAFVAATRQVYEKWTKTVGAELVKKAETSIAKR